MKVWLKLSVQTFKGVWKFDCKLATKLSGGYESWTANVQSKFQGVCKFDCTISIKVSRGMQVWLQMFNQTFNAIQKKHQRCSKMFVVFVWNQSNPPRFVQVFPHNNAQMFFLVDQINPPGFAYVVLMRVILRQQSNPTARNQFCFKFENKSWSK